MLQNRRHAFILMAVLVVAVFSGAIERVTDMLFHPWALADPPLFGRWAGHMTPGNGVPLAIAIELHRYRGSDGETCSRCNQIEGSGVTCDAAGTVRPYSISGSPRDRHGRELHLGAKPPDPPPDGLELDTLHGGWDGVDLLTLDADFFWRRGTSGISSTDDPATQPVPLRMQRIEETDLTAACKRLMKRS